MKRILSVVAAVMFAVMAASPAMAVQYEDGDFLVGIVGTTNTLGMEFGAFDIADDSMTEGKIVNLFDITDIGATFSGDTSLDQLRVVGAGAVNFFDLNSFSQTQNAFFAVERDGDWSLSSANFVGYHAQVTESGTVHSDGAVGGATQMPNAGLAGTLANGDLNGFLTSSTLSGTASLADLAAGNNIEMDIYSADGNNGWEVTQTEWVLTIGLEGNMVYAEVAPVPVPGALILLGSGIMALVGVRRKNA